MASQYSKKRKVNFWNGGIVQLANGKYACSLGTWTVLASSRYRPHYDNISRCNQHIERVKRWLPCTPSRREFDINTTRSNTTTDRPTSRPTNVRWKTDDGRWNKWNESSSSAVRYVTVRPDRARYGTLLGRSTNLRRCKAVQLQWWWYSGQSNVREA